MMIPLCRTLHSHGKIQLLVLFYFNAIQLKFQEHDTRIRKLADQIRPDELAQRVHKKWRLFDSLEAINNPSEMMEKPQIKDGETTNLTS